MPASGKRAFSHPPQGQSGLDVMFLPNWCERDRELVGPSVPYRRFGQGSLGSGCEGWLPITTQGFGAVVAMVGSATRNQHRQQNRTHLLHNDSTKHS